jgi:hypothetical protein
LIRLFEKDILVGRSCRDLIRLSFIVVKCYSQFCKDRLDKYCLRLFIAKILRSVSYWLFRHPLCRCQQNCHRCIGVNNSRRNKETCWPICRTVEPFSTFKFLAPQNLLETGAFNPSEAVKSGRVFLLLFLLSRSYKPIKLRTT